MTPAPRIAIVGYGAMASALAAQLARSGELRIGAALVRPQTARPVPEGMARLDSLAALKDWRPDLVVECAGHGALAQIAPAMLAAGVPVVATSIGALCDPDLRAALESAARQGGARLILASGALGGLDALRTAARAGLERVEYRGVKPPAAWMGSPAEQLVDLSAIAAPTVFFEGDAAEAARRFPQNANVAAAAALAGIGFERTRVALVADPSASVNRHELTAEGPAGRFAITLENAALPENPRTSWLAALSVEEAVRSHFAAVAF